jgi:hypothetical protein
MRCACFDTNQSARKLSFGCVRYDMRLRVCATDFSDQIECLNNSTVANMLA